MKLFFDLDGTLLDSRQKYHQLYLDALGGAAGRRLDLDAYWGLKRERIDEAAILDRTGHAGLVEAYTAQRLALIETERYLALDKPFAGVHQWLCALRACHSTYLVTGRKRRQPLLAQLELLGLTDLFDRVLSRDDNPGTAQVKVDLVADEARGREHDCCIIGDTEIEVAAGNLLGITTIAVATGIRSAAWLAQTEPDHLLGRVQDMTRLRRFVAGWALEHRTVVKLRPQ